MRNQKGFATILILLAVAAIGAMVYWFSKPGHDLAYLQEIIRDFPKKVIPPPKGCYYEEVMCVTAPCPPVLRCPAKEKGSNASHEPNGSVETANWKTYVSTPASFSIKYPANWYSTISGDGGVTVKLSNVKNSLGVCNDCIIVMVETTTQPAPKNFPYSDNSEVNSTIKTYLVNSYKGIRGKQETEMGDQEIVYLENPKGGSAMLTFYFTGEREVALKAFDQILSTFKFTK